MACAAGESGTSIASRLGIGVRTVLNRPGFCGGHFV
ncbi:hypothetical protein ACIOWK_30145 [Pseudomonas protegens]